MSSLILLKMATGAPNSSLTDRGNRTMRFINAILFFCFLTPLGLIARVFRLNEIRLKPDDRRSYWVDRGTRVPDVTQFERDH